MFENDLREALVKLAQEHSEMREYLLPLIKEASTTKIIGVAGISTLSLKDDGRVIAEIILKQPFPEAIKRLSLAAKHNKLVFVRNLARNNSFELSTPDWDSLPNIEGDDNDFVR
jgi:hypothetical protein